MALAWLRGGQSGSQPRRLVEVVAAHPFVALVAALLLGGVVRATQLHSQSLWEDEITSGFLAQIPASQLLRLTAVNDPHPPLYYLLAHAAYADLHLGMVDALRMPSLVAGIATVAVMYLLGWRLAGRWAGAVAATLTAISPMAVWYSHEGRMYAVTWFFVALSYLLLALARERPRPVWLVPYTVVTALALWSDISAFLGVVPQLAVIAATPVAPGPPGRPALGGFPKPWSRALATRWWPVLGFLGALVLYAPWLASLRTQWSLLTAMDFGIPSTWQVWTALALAQVGLQGSYATLPDLVPGALVALVLCAYAAIAVIGWRTAWPRAMYGVALALGPIALGLALALLGSRAVLVPRVEGVSSLGFGLLAGLLVAGALRSPDWSRRAAAGLAAVVIASGTAVGLAHEIRAGTNNQPWNVWVRQLDRDAGPVDAIFIVPTALQVATSAYLPADSRVNVWANTSWGQPRQELDANLLEQGTNGEHLWILYLDTTGIDIKSHDAFLRSHGFHRIAGNPALRMGVLGYSRT